MALSDKDTIQLKALLALLRQSFQGASFGVWKVDDMAESLERAIQNGQPTADEMMRRNSESR